MERYQHILKTAAAILAVLWSVTLLVLCCLIYPPYGMLLSVTDVIRGSLLSRLSVASLLIAAAYFITREPEERKATGSCLLFSFLAVLIALISFFTKELPDLSYRSDLTSASVFFLAPLFLIGTVKKRISAKPYRIAISILWTVLLAASVFFSFLRHILFQTVFDLFLILPFSLLSALLLLSSSPDEEQRAVILAADLALPGFVVLRRFFAVDAIVFPSIVFPATALLLLCLTVRRILRAKKNPEKNDKNKK